jgi:chromosome segregation ATPase
MLVTLGFLVASLLGLLVASAFWARAVRLTTRRIKQSMPVSEVEIKADRDRLRAEYAIRVHKLETQLEQTKLERARQLIEINRRDASISTLETDVVVLKSDLEENLNARRVLEQTVADRLPRVEARLSEAKRLLFNRDREISELSQGAKKHKQALEEAGSIHVQQSSEIDRLTTALTTRGGRNRQSTEPRFEGEVALRTEIETLRGKTREQASLIDRLQRRLGPGYVMPAAIAQGDGDMDRLRHNISEAEAALNSVRTAAATEGDASRMAYEREIRSLKARAEDQAGEIARLRAALATFEQSDQGGGGLKDTRIALKARLGSAEAQAHQQTATINRLRAELAATHERLARQAAHFMNEMRRIGAGTVPVTGPSRRGARSGDGRSLVERVAQVRGTAQPPPSTPMLVAAKVNGPDAPPADKAAANGRDVKAEGAVMADNGAAKSPPAAAETPKAAPIPGPRRKLRLLDRITGLAKG